MFFVPIFNKRSILKYGSCLSTFLYLIDLVNFAIMAYLCILLSVSEADNSSPIYRITNSHHNVHGSNQLSITPADGNINYSSANCTLVLSSLPRISIGFFQVLLLFAILQE